MRAGTEHVFFERIPSEATFNIVQIKTHTERSDI